jgi:hypothetical protein
MKRCLILIAVLSCGTPLARAQVDFSCRFPVTQVLAYEALPAVVTVHNHGPRPLRNEGTNAFTLAFEISDGTGALRPLRPGRAPALPTQVDPGATITFTNDLQMLYDIDGLSAFNVRARLLAESRWYGTDKSFVDVSPGAVLLRVDQPLDDGGLRTYTLRSLNREGRDRLFLRIDDEASGIAYAAVELGRLVAMGKPTLRFDNSGRAHILHLSGPNQFTYSIFTTDGQPVSQEIVRGEASSVRLEPDGRGGLEVRGAGPAPSTSPSPMEALPMRRRL